MERPRWKQPNVDICPPCPRCGSSNTKFCYYNNYSLTQPRYFCKGCRRYWTKGGSLRNIPVGGGCRKTRRARSIRISDVGTHQGFLAHGGGGGGLPAAVQPPAAGGASIDIQQVYNNFLNQRPEMTSQVEVRRDRMHGEAAVGFCGAPGMEMEFGGVNLEGFVSGGGGLHVCGYSSVFDHLPEGNLEKDCFVTGGGGNYAGYGLPPFPGEELRWPETNMGFSEHVLGPLVVPEGQDSGECPVKTTTFDMPVNSDTIFKP